MKTVGVFAVVLVVVAGAVFWMHSGPVPETQPEPASIDTSHRQGAGNERPTDPPALSKQMPIAKASSVAPSTNERAGEPNIRSVLSDAQRQELESQEHARIEKAHRAVYEDVAATLALNADEYDALIQVLVDQQMHQVADEGTGQEAGMRPTFNTFQQGRREAIESLLGAPRATAFAEYERTLNARFEVLELRQALERADVPLTDRQRKTLIDSAIERGAYAPPLRFTGNAIDADNQRILAQEALRDQKMLGVAQGVLTPEQYAEYERYQALRRTALELATFPAGAQQKSEQK